MHKIALALIAQFLLTSSSMENITHRNDVRAFLTEMQDAHGFPQQRLYKLFSRVKISDSILQAISRPAEKLAWYKYRSYFVQQDRVQRGVEFWRRHKNILARAEREFGVPQEIMVAIIGVETFYGKQKGGYRVLDALSTLAFDYPKRSKFFRSELEQYLLLTREQNVDPLTLKGSYAGAMGIPQFISSSYRHYAIDFDNDGHIDIWNNPYDAIGSVANYFKLHNWLPGGPVTVKATAINDQYHKVISTDLKPALVYSELVAAGIRSAHKIANNEKVTLIELELADGVELWLGLHNFYVITRYNHSALYAMAVYQLSAKIKAAYMASQQ